VHPGPAETDVAARAAADGDALLTENECHAASNLIL
jgi:hypothetical protein